MCSADLAHVEAVFQPHHLDPLVTNILENKSNLRGFFFLFTKYLFDFSSCVCVLVGPGRDRLTSRPLH